MSNVLVHNVVKEMQAFRDGQVPPLGKDVDMVWALAGPGTYDSPSTDGPYAAPASSPELSYDRHNIDAGILAVQGVTAERLAKKAKDVTPEDVAEHGPVFFYNGESDSTAGQRYDHNRALAAAVGQPGFPLPASKVVIEPIDRGITPAQVESYAAYRDQQVERGETPANRIAVAALFWHLPRVGRYLKHYEERFPGVTFLPVPVRVPKSETAWFLARGEVKRVAAYRQAEHLAAESAFQTTSAA